MSLKCGIVGLPNVGKSTLFNALTKAGIAAENYPFCTIEPNVGIVEVPDPRLAALAAIAKPERVLPAVVEFVDIAGLVAGASKGEGLGNKFLANIRETDAIAHVVRCFVDDNVVHVTGEVESALGHRDDQYRAGAGRPGRRREAGGQGGKAGARRRQGGAARPGRLAQGRDGARYRPAGAHRRPLSGGEGNTGPVLPADDEADDVRRERRRAWLPRQPAARRRRGACGEGRRAGRVGLRVDGGRDRRPVRRGQERVSRGHGRRPSRDSTA